MRPIPGAPFSWSWRYLSNSSTISREQRVIVQCKQPLREVIGFVLTDEHGNVCQASKYLELQPNLSISKVEGDRPAPEKQGDWNSCEILDTETDKYWVLKPDACLGGEKVHFELMISSQISDASPITNGFVKMSLFPGSGTYLRVTFRNFLPQDMSEERRSHSFTGTTEILNWPSCCKIELISIEIVDEWGNHCTNNSTIPTRNRLSEWCVMANHARLSETRSADSSDRITKKLPLVAGKAHEIKNIFFHAEKGIQTASIKVMCLSDLQPSLSAEAVLKVMPTNRVIEVSTAPGPGLFLQHRAGEPFGKLMVTLDTEDGQSWNGPVKILSESVSICARLVQDAEDPVDVSDIFRDVYVVRGAGDLDDHGEANSEFDAASEIGDSPAFTMFFKLKPQERFKRKGLYTLQVCSSYFSWI